MFKTVLVVLCVSAYVNCATVPTIEGLLPPTRSPAHDIHENINENLISTNDINEAIVNNEQNICLTETCAKESALMRSYLDDSVDPCDNFYQFACGNFIKGTTLPEDKPILMSFVQVQDKVQEQLVKVITEEPEPNESKPFKLAKMFYKLCMDETALNENGIKPMQEILEKYDGWPVVKGNQWNAENWDWIEAIKKISYDGLRDSIILTFHIVVDSKNSTKRTLAIDQPVFGTSGKFLQQGIGDPNVKAYYDFMVDAAVLFGANRTNAETELFDSLLLEIELAKISLNQEDRRNQSVLYNPFTVKQLQTTYPYINWMDYINWNLHNSHNIDENEIVIVHDVNYMDKLHAILLSAPKRTMANYFAWRSVLLASDMLNDALHARLQQYLATTTGMLKSDPRQTECIKRTMENLLISVGATYVRKYFNEDTKKAATILANTIHEEFLKTLQKVSWMDEETKVAAIEKAHSVEYHIAYPNELTDNNKLEEYYDGLELDPNSYLQSILNIRKFNRDDLIDELRKPVNKTDWENHSLPSIVNAFYSLLENSVQLPAAVLQDRFFSVDRPSYMNFGAIGWFVGHEVTHGFDDEGRQFDKNGVLSDWWQADTATKFASKAQCIIDQYSNYTKPGTDLRVNGVNTQGENIADNGAVKGMYGAYQTFVERNGPEPTLPDLNYTQNQLFWISAAQLWCAVTRPEFDTLQYTTDVHAPNEWRIIGTFRNQDSFSRDFNCPSGTPMNPVNKCEVW